MSIDEATYKGFRSLAMLQDKKISQIVEQLTRSYINEQGGEVWLQPYHDNPELVSYYDIRDKERGNR